MRPRDLRPDVVQARLAQMRELLDDLDRVGEVSTGLLAERFLRHVVEHVLIQLVQLAVAINSHVAASVGRTAVTDSASSFAAAASVGMIDPGLAIALTPSVGLRNVVVHSYLDVDLALVAAAVPLAREHYAAYVTQVARWLVARQQEQQQ